jgi:hypothetical protein
MNKIVSSKVEWFNKLTELNFSKDDFLKIIGKFKQRLAID